jgi:hypothetical protein
MKLRDKCARILTQSLAIEEMKTHTARPKYYMLANNGLNPLSLDSERYDWSVNAHCESCREPQKLSAPVLLCLQDTEMGRVPLNMIQSFSRIV